MAQIDRRQFWAEPDRWPVDAPGYVFLADAVDQLGRSTGSNWSLTDAWATSAPPILPKVQPDPRKDRKSVEQGYGLLSLALRRKSVDVVAAPYSKAENSLAMRTRPIEMLAPLSPEQWHEAVVRSVVEHNRSEARRLRWLLVLETTIALLREGRLVVHTRGLAGATSNSETGFDDAMPARFWVMENPEIRFAFCQIDWARPFDQQYPRSNDRQRSALDRAEDFRFIYVSEDSLKACLNQASAPPGGSGDPLEERASGFGNDPAPQGNGPTVQVLVDALWSAWHGVPVGFPNNQSRYDAIWAEVKAKQPKLTDAKRPSEDSFERAEKAVKAHQEKSNLR